MAKLGKLDALMREVQAPGFGDKLACTAADARSAEAKAMLNQLHTSPHAWWRVPKHSIAAWAERGEQGVAAAAAAAEATAGGREGEGSTHLISSF